MKTSELIKKAEELLGKALSNPLGLNTCLDESEFIFYVFARNHMQELIDKLKKYESALKTIGEFNNEDFSDPSVDMASFARKALGDE